MGDDAARMTGMPNVSQQVMAENVCHRVTRNTGLRERKRERAREREREKELSNCDL